MFLRGATEKFILQVFFMNKFVVITSGWNSLYSLFCYFWIIKYVNSFCSYLQDECVIMSLLSPTKSDSRSGIHLRNYRNVIYANTCPYIRIFPHRKWYYSTMPPPILPLGRPQKFFLRPDTRIFSSSDMRGQLIYIYHNIFSYIYHKHTIKLVYFKVK